MISLIFIMFAFIFALMIPTAIFEFFRDLKQRRKWNDEYIERRYGKWDM